jgi:hypothetical protein
MGGEASCTIWHVERLRGPPCIFFLTQYVREWVKKRTGFDSDFRVTFYPGRYAPEKCSILPVGDPTQYVPDHEVGLGPARCEQALL